MDFDEYEFQVEAQRNKNNELLTEFESTLKKSGLSDKTVDKHMYNIDFYINYFLLYEEIIEPELGVDNVRYFFNGWFPRKAMWSNPTNVSATCTVLKKFYGFLQLKGKVTADEMSELNRKIKTEKIEWQSHYLRNDLDW